MDYDIIMILNFIDLCFVSFTGLCVQDYCVQVCFIASILLILSRWRPRKCGDQLPFSGVFAVMGKDFTRYRRFDDFPDSGAAKPRINPLKKKQSVS